MKLAIIGGRNFDKWNLFEDNFLIHYQYRIDSIDEIVSGGAIGVDSLAAELAKIHDIKLKVFRPEYDKYPGKIAPLKRNEQIMEYCDEVFAIWDGVSRGTANSLGIAKKLKKNTTIIYF